MQVATFQPTQNRRDDEDRNRVLRQAIQLCRHLADRPMTLEEMAAAIEMGPRNVRRVISALRLAGIDIEALAADPDDDMDDPRVRQTYGARRIAIRYTLDRRAWNGALCLPRD